MARRAGEARAGAGLGGGVFNGVLDGYRGACPAPRLLVGARANSEGTLVEGMF